MNSVRLLIAGLVLLCLGAGYFLLTRMPVPSTPARPAIGEAVVSETAPFVTAYHHGEGPRVILVPSAGRESSDFNELVTAITEAGYATIALDPPGVAGADIPDNPTLADFAAPLFEHMDKDVILIGHAFGNRAVRMAAHLKPENVKGVILIAAGGQKPIPPKAETALRNAFHPLRSHKSRMEDVRYAFFAGDNPIPEYWTRGWHTRTAMAQGQAVAATTDTDWQAAGGAPLLVIQADQDRIAPKADTADLLKARYPSQVEIVLVRNASHALLPEQPDAVASAVLRFLNTRHN